MKNIFYAISRLLFAAALLFLSAAFACAADPAAGRWEGSAAIPARLVPLVIDLAQDGAGKWNGSAILPGTGVKGAPLSEIKINSADLSFALPDVLGGLILKGKVAADGTITGDFQQGGNSAPFTLKRIGTPQVELPIRNTPVAKEVEGEWKGDYELMGYTRHVTLKIANQSAGDPKVELTIVGKKTNNVGVDLVTQEGDFLTIHSNAFGINLEGLYHKDSDTLNLTLTQGPFEVPFVLHRAGAGKTP